MIALALALALAVVALVLYGLVDDRDGALIAAAVLAAFGAGLLV